MDAPSGPWSNITQGEPMIVCLEDVRVWISKLSKENDMSPQSWGQSMSNFLRL